MSMKLRDMYHFDCPLIPLKIHCGILNNSHFSHSKRY
jgi:hypothetical protein